MTLEGGCHVIFAALPHSHQLYPVAPAVAVCRKETRRADDTVPEVHLNGSRETQAVVGLEPLDSPLDVSAALDLLWRL